MTFPTDDILLGPQAYGKRKGSEGIIFHTTEGSGPSRAQAVATVKLQSPGGALYNGGGSYNFVIYDGGVLLTVPYLESCGGVTSNHTAPPNGSWSPKAWLSGALSPAAMADTNAYMLQIAFSGKAVELAAGRYPSNMIETAARLVLWFEQQSWGADNAVVSSHSDWQSNRSDPGVGVVDKILDRYKTLVSGPAVAPPVPTPIASIDYAGKPNPFGTRYPTYVHTVEQAFAWTNRAIAYLKAAGKI